MQETVYRVLCALTGETAPAVLVAVSGGRDSMALLHALCFGARAQGARVRAVHIDHGLRRESAGEAQAVRCACRAWRVPLEVVTLDIEKQKKPGESVEMAARRLRYQALYGARRAGEWIATAHHQEDLAETVLMRILQGTGLRGLRGIPSKNGAVVRPMLHIDRAEIDAYVKSYAVGYVEDRSNREEKFLRNRVRHALMPQLKTRYNPQLTQALCRLAGYAEQEEAYFAPLVQAAEKTAFLGEVDGAGVWYDRAALEALDEPVLARWAGQTLIQRGLRADERMIRTIMAACHAPGAADLAGGWRIKSGTRLELFRADLPAPPPMLLTDRAVRSGPWRMEITPAEKPARYPNKTALVQLFDADALSWPCVVRMSRAGDAMQMPYGQKSISDLYTDEKTPMAVRLHFPVVESGGRIVWAVGAARGKLANITSETRRMIAMRFTYTLEEEHP